MLAAVLCLAVGANLSVLTVTVMRDQEDPYAAMQTAGPASIFWSLGLRAALAAAASRCRSSCSEDCSRGSA